MMVVQFQKQYNDKYYSMYFIYCNGHYLNHKKNHNDPFNRSMVSCSESKDITNQLWNINEDNSINGFNGENIISNHIGWMSERSNILLLGEHDYDLIIYPLKMIYNLGKIYTIINEIKYLLIKDSNNNILIMRDKGIEDKLISDKWEIKKYNSQ